MQINERVLQKDINHYLRTFAETYAKEASFEITKLAKIAIQKFYDDYAPKYYDRTFDLLNNSYAPYYHDNGRTIRGGVKIGWDNMQPYYRKSKTYGDYADPKWIADDAWRKGMHGRFGGIVTTPPLNMVKEAMKEKSFLDKIQKKGSAAAAKQKYTILQIKG